MKKYILPVVLLAILAGCGKVKTPVVDESQIDIVSGTAVATTSQKKTTTEAETTTDDGDKKTTTTKTAGDKISGTTTSVKSTGRVVTRASGGSDGVVHGTTRVVPTAPRTTSRTTTSSTSTQQPTTETPTIDPKDYNSISFEFKGAKTDKIEVMRPYTDGKMRSFQALTVDTSEIKEYLEKNPNKTINDRIVTEDFDGDGYPDLFVVEKEDELNKTGKYFKYDSDKGTFISWDELNALKFEIKLDSSSNRLIVLDKKEDKIEYEKKSYEWNGQNKLVLREYIHQYTTDGDILIDYINYDENGSEISRETRDSSGNLVGDSTEPTTQEQNEE